MEQDDKAIPIAFIRDSRHVMLDSSVLAPVRAYADQVDRAGIEDVITFLTQSQPPE